MSSSGSVAPKERINIKYVPATGDQKAEVELPLRMLVMGDFKGHREDSRLEERQAIRVDKNTFSSVMRESDLSLNINIDNKLSDEMDEDAVLPVSLKINGLDDFSPDGIVKQVPELKKMLELREALVALKGPLGSLPKFRKGLQELLDSPDSKAALEEEISKLMGNEENTEEGVE